MPASRRFRVTTLATAVVLALSANLSIAVAQAPAATAPVAVDVPAQPLGRALNELARQANLQMSFPADLVSGRSAPAVTGRLTAQEALARMLAGSGLVADVNGPAVVVKQAPPPPPVKETQMPSVTVTAEADEFQPQRIAIDRREIERLNPTDLQDLFKAQPGIQVGSSIPMSQKLYVYGIEETNLAVTIDGNRQNNKIFHHSATTLIDPSLMKAVRIDPGVAPADAGPGALAGSVAYETVDASELLLPGQRFGGLLKGDYETNGDVYSGSAALFGRNGDGFEYLAFLKGASGDLREDGDGQEIIGSGTKFLSGLTKVAYQAPSGDRFEFSYDAVHDDEDRPYRANIGRINAGRPVPATRPYDLKRQNATVTYTDRTPKGWWDPKVQLGYSKTELNLPEADQQSDGYTDSFSGNSRTASRSPRAASRRASTSSPTRRSSTIATSKTLPGTSTARRSRATSGSTRRRAWSRCRMLACPSAAAAISSASRAWRVPASRTRASRTTSPANSTSRPASWRARGTRTCGPACRSRRISS